MGTITSSDIGNMYCQCHNLKAEPQADGYITNIQFVPTSPTGTSNSVNYNIVADCIPQTDGQVHPVSILIKADKTLCVGYSSTYTFGTIHITLDDSQ